MLSPMTTMFSTRSARRSYAAAAASDQSDQSVVCMSASVVPCPGRRGCST